MKRGVYFMFNTNMLFIVHKSVRYVYLDKEYQIVTMSDGEYNDQKFILDKDKINYFKRIGEL